jgi:hypothetical protein
MSALHRTLVAILGGALAVAATMALSAGVAYAGGGLLGGLGQPGVSSGNPVSELLKPGG